MCATSPEELETLLEDALLLGDDAAAAALFEDRGIVIARDGSVSARTEAVSLLAGRPGYLASTQPATVIGNIAVVIGDLTANVSRRGPDGSWRLVASVYLPGAR